MKNLSGIDENGNLLDPNEETIDPELLKTTNF